jgi:hypothetical protein
MDLAQKRELVLEQEQAQEVMAGQEQPPGRKQAQEEEAELAQALKSVPK